MRVETESVRVGGVVEAVTAEEGDDAAEAEAREGGTIAAEAPRQHHRRVGFWGGRHEECVKSKSGEARGPEGGKEGKNRNMGGWGRGSCVPGSIYVFSLATSAGHGGRRRVPFTPHAMGIEQVVGPGGAWPAVWKKLERTIAHQRPSRDADLPTAPSRRQSN